MSETGFDVNDEVDVGDLSDQTGQELLEAAKGVQFVVKEAKLQEVKPKDSDEILMKKLNVQAKIGPLGVDGNGRYAGKVMFAELIVWFDPERYNSDWWKKQAKFPLKSFLQATGYDVKNPPKINDAFREELKGKGFLADITVRNIQAKNDEGKWINTDDKKNELTNYKKVGE